MSKNTIIHGDVYSGINSLDDNSISVVITSPPYWGQRDYGFDDQLGCEATYQEYIGKLIAIFRVLKDKLKDDGIFLLNMGDKYIPRYGKSYLGLIPYKLAYFMKKDGWILNDILIWYKPNHMPSGVKNRFTNTYEPVFVFSKSKDNRYKKLSTILKVKLQPSKYKHIAVYPEKLVEELLERVDFPSNIPRSTFHVLDPFAGSGTTGKVAIEHGLSCTMIEASKEYVKIIQDRCKIDNIISLPPIAYQPVEIKEESLNITHSNANLPNILITDNKDEYYNALSSLPTNTNIPYFLGFKELDIDVIYKTSLINNHGLSVRNMLIVNTGDKTFSVFMITGREKYSFNLDSIKVAHKSSIDWQSKDFTDYKVIDRLNDKVGSVVSIDEKYLNGFPKWATVLWNDGKASCEYVIYDEKDIPKIQFICSKCGRKIDDSCIECPNCRSKIWIESFIKVVEDEEFLREVEFHIKKNIDISPATYHSLLNSHLTSHISHLTFNGASPGKRAALQGEYFFAIRLYNVNQKLVSDFLDYKRKEKGLSRKDVIDRLPSGYKYKAEHWFRKDMGGSIPSPKDWILLKEILDIDDYDNYVLSKCLKLQAVKPLRDGKNVGDYLEMEEDRLVEFLEKVIKK